jgi:microcystin-dependent protein
MSNAQGYPGPAVPIVDPASGFLAAPWARFFLNLWNRTGGGQASAGFQAGGMQSYAGSVAPSGWLLCDGTAISRTTYSALFAAIGISWGAGDGITTFNLPNFTGRVEIGAGPGFALGSYGGASTVALTVGNLPSHNHGIIDPQHNHTSVVAASNVTTGTAAGGVIAGTDAEAYTEISVQATGGNQPFSIMPPYACVNKIIKT